MRLGVGCLGTGKVLGAPVGVDESRRDKTKQYVFFPRFLVCMVEFPFKAEHVAFKLLSLRSRQKPVPFHLPASETSLRG